MYDFAKKQHAFAEWTTSDIGRTRWDDLIENIYLTSFTVCLLTCMPHNLIPFFLPKGRPNQWLDDISFRHNCSPPTDLLSHHVSDAGGKTIIISVTLHYNQVVISSTFARLQQQRKVRLSAHPSRCVHSFTRIVQWSKKSVLQSSRIKCCCCKFYIARRHKKTRSKEIQHSFCWRWWKLDEENWDNCEKVDEQQSRSWQL